MAKWSWDARGATVAGVTVSVRALLAAATGSAVVWFVLMNTAMVDIHLWGVCTVRVRLWALLAGLPLAGAIGCSLIRRRLGGSRSE
ncbi:DUF1049 domain-containing protein [Streptacidiphilus rugosus]|uniref:DUF1049 domain-containing protein n=1 Tax=Streptacidiphilus rugosus TaxID=405783 RepID=UPI0012FB69F5|nr:DUF1049 domain-containing protein [Streptacidiphilus rugosus]